MSANDKAAAKLAECLKAIKTYAGTAEIPASIRVKGLIAAVATIRELMGAFKAQLSDRADSGR